jgi:ribonuclease R
LEKRFSRESEQLVEECMLAANQAVGKELLRKSIAGIYRIHPFPEPEKTMEFSDLMHENFNLPVGDISDRKTCRSFIESLPDDGKKTVILNLLLRSLPRASYSIHADIHFALGKTLYAHFTSPIRRYPDLIVHQQLWNFDHKIRTRSGSTLEKAAAWASEQEEHTDEACYAAADRMKLRILQEELEQHPERLYDGIVVKVMAAGLQVDVDEFGIYGFVERDRLRPRRSLSMRAGDPRKTDWKTGDYICLRLVGIDFARGSAKFMPAR